MDIHHRIVLGAVSIFSSLGMFTLTVSAENKQSNFTHSSQFNQTSQSSQINFTLKVESNQSFTDLMQQAESLATSALEQGFAENPSIAEISISILAERNGQEAPLLFSKVSRPDWQRQPKIRQWTKYFASSATLLGFLKPQVQQSVPSSEETVRRSTPPTSEDTSVQPPPSNIRTPLSPSPGNHVQNGAILERRDSGIR